MYTVSTRTCEHPACACSVAPDRLYCSESCRRAAEGLTTSVTPCTCGHAECHSDTGKRSDKGR